jgi:hypothetical protein
MLQVGNVGLSREEQQSMFSMWCIVGAPLLAGTDLVHASTATLAILTNREAIAVNQVGERKNAARERNCTGTHGRPQRNCTGTASPRRLGSRLSHRTAFSPATPLPPPPPPATGHALPSRSSIALFRHAAPGPRPRRRRAAGHPPRHRRRQERGLGQGPARRQERGGGAAQPGRRRGHRSRQLGRPRPRRRRLVRPVLVTCFLSHCVLRRIIAWLLLMLVLVLALELSALQLRLRA